MFSIVAKISALPYCARVGMPVCDLVPGQGLPVPNAQKGCSKAGKMPH